MKTLIRLAAVLAVGLALAVGGVLLAIDSLARAGIEKGAGHALGVPTRVGSVRIGLLRGSFRMGGLRVSNPPGFEADHLLELRSARFEVPPAALREPTISVPLFALEGVDVVLERREGRTNTSVILQNLKRFESGGKKSTGPEEGAGRKLVIEELVIADVRARVDVVDPLLQVAELRGLEIEIPEIRLRKVGSAGGGVTSAELANIVTKAVFANVAKYGTRLPPGIAGELRGGLDSLTRVPTEVSGEVVTKLGGEVAERLPGAARAPAEDAARRLGDEARKALGGLFGEEKDE